MSIGKFKKDELRSIADELKLVVPDNAKVLDLRELIQESEIYKNDKETYQAIVDCVLEEINDKRNENENRLEIEKIKLSQLEHENENRLEIEKIKLSQLEHENENRLEIEKIKLSQLEKELEIAKLHNQSVKSLPLQNENQLITTECNIETGQPNSSKVSSQPARRCIRGPGGSNCVVPPQGENEENKSFVATSFLKNKTRTVLLSSVQCFLRDKYGLLHEVRALLDVGSQSHFITKDCADRLQLKNEKINLLVSCLNESTMTINGGVTTSIFNGDLSFKKELNLLVVRRITDLTPSQIINVSLDMPNEIKLADYKFNIPGKIDVLLGAEIFYELLRPGQIYCGDSRLLLQNTVFGYVVSGSVGDEVRDNNIHCGLIRDSDLNTTLRSFWELESIGVKNENCSSEEDVSFEMFKQRVHFKNGRYEVELPWKRDSNELSDNFSLAKRRLGSLMRKMQRDKVLYSGCLIIKNESLTTKLRLVFDASAHEEKQLSLNDCLFHGVNLNPNILDLLISSNKIAVLADVEKAFLQISLAPKDRDVVRFLIDDGENGVQVYRFNRVLFGVNASPFFLAATIKTHIGKYMEKYPDTVRTLDHCFYVDDLVTGEDDAKSAFDLSSKAAKIMSEAGMNLRKWISNDCELMKQWQLEHFDHLNMNDFVNHPHRVFGAFMASSKRLSQSSSDQSLRLPSKKKEH
ncbi:integrase catalytic domain-containing protein [Trichonephila clavipes]|nr:integrase catalytic domain-containing protein [Trichonephila clavipes]